MIAGAIRPTGVGELDEASDRITARRYRHAALGDRPVVRLVPETLGPAEDLSAEFLGFTEPERSPVVGVGPRGSLGFPAWALVHDPANAHHALNLVKDIEKLARIARSKPGAAKDGFTALGDRLGLAAPQLLPSFYEQAGRIYLEHGNPTFAGTMFGRAREAEQVHGLPIDPAHLRTVFLEFAFGGALTAKVLSLQAKNLGQTLPPEQALSEFAGLCVERIKGGLAPYAGMPEDIARLAKAARKPLAELNADILRQLMDTPAISKAGKGFWKYYRSTFLALAKDPASRDRLLAFVPEDIDSHELWLEILADSGATTGLTDASPVGLPAAWLSKMAASRFHWRWSCGRLAPLLDLVTRMAPRLRADDVAVDLHGNYDETDPDLLDLCLAERIPLVTRPGLRPVDLERWVADSGPGRRDLVGLAEHRRPQLIESLWKYVQRSPFDRPIGPAVLAPLLETPGLRTALADLLRQEAQRLRGDSLWELRVGLMRLRGVRSQEAFVDTPETAKMIAETTVAHGLAATLRAGIFDEFGWPALEQAVATMVDADKRPPGSQIRIDIVGDGWPALIIGHRNEIVVVGPDKILLEHVVRIPANLAEAHQPPQASYVDGKLLVTWNGPDGALAYWSDDPANIFKPKRAPEWRWQPMSRWQVLPTVSIPIPDGGRFSGSRKLHAGDTEFPARLLVHSDGGSYWRVSDGEWREVDPETGTTGRRSLPSWIQDFDSADVRHSWLRPAPPGTESSPLGHTNGMLGWRVRQQPDKSWICERIDGVRVGLSEPNVTPLAALVFPGGRRQVVTAMSASYATYDEAGNRQGVFSSYTYRPDLATGTMYIPSLPYWHCLRVRDEAGSLALRSVTEQQAARLLADEDVADVLPEITHPELVRGVLGLVKLAKDLRVELDKYNELAPTPSMPTRPVKPVADDRGLYNALCWTGVHHGLERARLAIMSTLAELAAARDNPAAGRVVNYAFEDWSHALAHPAAVAWRAASPFTPAVERAELIKYLRAYAELGFADGGWRTIGVVPEKPAEGVVTPTADGFVVVWQATTWGTGMPDWQGVQFSRGKHTLPKNWTLQTADEFDKFPAKRILEFCSQLESNGPVPWRPPARPEVVTELAAGTGLSLGEASYLLAGLIGVRDSRAAALTPEIRKALDLSANLVGSVRERFGALSGSDQLALLSAAIPTSPLEMWVYGPKVPAIIDAWVKRFGQRLPVPDGLLADARKQLPFPNTAEFISAIANPDTCTWLTTDSLPEYKDGRLVPTIPGRFTGQHLLQVSGALPWLAYHLPVGSPIREQLPKVLRLLRDRLRHPEFLVEVGSVYQVGLKPIWQALNLPADKMGQPVDVDGWLQLQPSHYDGYVVILRTSEYRADRLPILRAVREMLHFGASGCEESMPVLFGDDLEQACAQRAPETVDPNAYFQDPSVSVPDLVSTVAEKYGLDADAAALYLQLLALPDPTDANIARWTGWKSTRLRKARAALAETELVVTAKRSRAGRTLFLPGGWRAHKSPYPPLEVWKAAMFGLSDAHPANPIVPPGTVEQLFRQAWQRILDGDLPSYEELQT